MNVEQGITISYFRRSGQRQQLIARSIGTLKRQCGFIHALVRGKKKGFGEVSLAFTEYHIRRSVSILGFSGLMEQL